MLIEDHQKVMNLNQASWAQTRQLEEANNALKHDLLKIVGESTIRKQVGTKILTPLVNLFYIKIILEPKITLNN